MRHAMIAISCAMVFAVANAANVCDVTMSPGEHWWGVCNTFGMYMPFTAGTRGCNLDLFSENYGGQPASLLLSDKGRVVWCPEQTRVSIDGGVISMESAGADVVVENGGKNLREAYLHASSRYFPPSGKMPDPLFFSAPQYNTWMELTYNQNEEGILAYAQSMLDNGLPPGVFMIDDSWQYSYGVWEFDTRKFSDPKGMCDKLHRMGFKVVLWVVPFVSLDSQPYRDLTCHGRMPKPSKGGFVVDADTKEPAHVSWWNGYSALLDLTDPVGDSWFRSQLDRLRTDYGVDGFKFDAGHFRFYASPNRIVHAKGASVAQQNHAYAVYGEDYPLSEHRCVWGMAGRPVMVRLPDKGNTWRAVKRLVPDMIAAGLLGYPFVCPDMIGGGVWTAYLPDSKTPFDKELFIRSAQVHALSPMMQFSVSPWRLMKDDPDGQRIIRDLVSLRQKFAPKFVELARLSGETGEPMIRCMEYAYPNMGYAEIRDQFLMGEDLLVAPVVEKGAKTRSVAIPPGRWRGDDGKVVEGPVTVEVATPIERLPYFVREGGACVANADPESASHPVMHVADARRVTSGPHEHLIANYFGINAWSADLRKLVALETDLNGRIPEIEDACSIGLVDIATGVFEPFAKTVCWNFQEAAMAHWLPSGELLYNDLRNGRFVTVVRNLASGRERIIPFPTSAVSPDGRQIISLNYARLRLTRPDYGYPGEGQDAREGVQWPDNDGLWSVDVATGVGRLIVSIASCRDMMPQIASAKGLAYFCHTTFSRDGSKIFWLARTVEDYDKASRKGDIGRKTVAFTCNADGTDVRRSFPDGWDGSHFNWKDGSTICVTAKFGAEKWTHVEYTVGEEKGAHVLGGGALDWDGHCTYSPDGRWLSTEGYRDSQNNRHWKILRLSDGVVLDAGSFFVPEAYRPAYWRCDLHARWRADGRQLAFNSAHEGSRQIYVRDVFVEDR